MRLKRRQLLVAGAAVTGAAMVPGCGGEEHEESGRDALHGRQYRPGG